MRCNNKTPAETKNNTIEMEMKEKPPKVLCNHCAVNDAAKYCAKCELDHSKGFCCNECDEEFHKNYSNHIREQIIS